MIGQAYSLSAQSAESDPPTEEELLEEAAKLYNLERYDEAAALYEQILRNGRHSAGLYFNLGNTHYKMGRLGPSIFYYEKALLLRPGDKEVQQNLRFARQMRIDDIEELPETFGQRVSSAFLQAFHFDTWAWLAVFSVFIASAFYIVYFVSERSRQKRLYFALGAIAGFFFVLCLSASIGSYNQYVREQPAILFADSVALTGAPNDRSEILFELHEGTKVFVLDQLDEWAKVRLQNGLTGWLPVRSFRLLKGDEIPEWGT